MKYTEEQIRVMICNYLDEDEDLSKFTDDEVEEILEDDYNMSRACHYSLIEDYKPLDGDWRGDILTVMWFVADAYDLFRIENGRLEKIVPRRQNKKQTKKRAIR